MPLTSETAARSTAPKHSAPALLRFSDFPPTTLYHATVAPGAPDLLDTTIRDAQFRRKFCAAIVSVRRQAQAITGKLGDLELQAGDELVFDVGPQFNPAAAIVLANLRDVGVAGDSAAKEFMIAFKVEARSPQRSSSFERGGLVKGMRGNGIVGKTIEAAGLRGLPDVFLVAIERASGETLHAVSPSEVLQDGDVLWFSGGTEAVITLRKIPGLKQVDNQVDKLTAHVLERRLVQVVISRNSHLIGRSVKECRFRSQFDAAIIAIHREGSRLRQRIGDVSLMAGDVLLLDTGSSFLDNHRGDRNFALVAEVANSRPPRFDRVAIAVVCAIAAIAVYTAGVTDLFTTALIASGVMLLAGCMSGGAARASIKWDVIVTIAAAFGISKAMEITEAAQAIADVLVLAGEALGGDVAVQVAVYIATVLLSNIVANNAAAALMYPIAANVALQKGLRVDLMGYLLMLAASASFAVPFGYQTNLMVYGAGGYSFKDFVKFGGPMQIWQGIASMAAILLADYWPVVWAVTVIAAVCTFTGPPLWAYLRERRDRRSDRRDGLVGAGTGQRKDGGGGSPGSAGVTHSLAGVTDVDAGGALSTQRTPWSAMAERV